MTRQAPRRDSLAEGGIVAGVVIAFALTAAIVLVVAPVFTWDEAVYALTPRHWLTGSPGTGWGPHRPLVLSALGVIPVVFGANQEAAFRLIGVAFGAGLILITWYLTRTLAGSVAGLLAAAAVASAPTLAGDAGLFLTDVPSTAVLLLVVVLVWRSFERASGPGRDLLWVSPAAAAAFYVRYGSLIGLVALTIAAAVIWPDRIRRRWRIVSATLALTALLLVPHAIQAGIQTGSPFGIALAAQSGARPAYPGEALVAYLGMVPSGLVGIVPGALTILGVVISSARLAADRLSFRDRHTRALVLLVLTGTVQVVVLGLLILPQVRYVYFGATLLVIAGCIGLVRIAEDGRATACIALIGVASAVLVSLVANPFVVWRSATATRDEWGWQRELGTIIGREGSGSCSVLATDVPQITWYSGCAAVNFGNRATDGDRDQLLIGRNRFLVVRADGVFQPAGALMAGYLARTSPEPVAVVRRAGGSIAATLYRFR